MQAKKSWNCYAANEKRYATALNQNKGVDLIQVKIFNLKPQLVFRKHSNNQSPALPLL